MKKTIIFDLDSTLNDMHIQVRNLFKEQYQIDLGNFEIPKNFPFTLDQIHELVEKHGLLTSTNLLPGAKELFESIRALGIEIGVITARKCFKNTADSITTDWLKKHELNVDWIDIISGEKHLIIKARKVDCLLFLDDDPKHLLDVSKAKFSKYVGTLSYPWTKNLPSEIIIFKNLAEVSRFVKKICCSSQHEIA